jgi:hypothetical protein
MRNANIELNIAHSISALSNFRPDCTIYIIAFVTRNCLVFKRLSPSPARISSIYSWLSRFPVLNCFLFHSSNCTTASSSNPLTHSTYRKGESRNYLFWSLERVFRNTICLVSRLVASDPEHDCCDCGGSLKAFLRIDWRFCRLRDIVCYADLFPRLVSRHGQAKLNVPLLAFEVGGGRGYGTLVGLVKEVMGWVEVEFLYDTQPRLHGGVPVRGWCDTSLTCPPPTSRFLVQLKAVFNKMRTGKRLKANLSV